MLNFSIDLESLDEYKEPARVFSFLSEKESNNKSLISLIGKVAAKKAFFKCIGVNENFKKIEIKNSPSGKPYIEIKDEKLKEVLKDKRIEISISHTKNIAVAICLVYERKD
ncbi:MAG TPA: 4'-phosphopantetheinyl transferase superfamily protein [bacterium]|nr:4'-phosphopantetheinyl transferase superfamily protein [bacterium]HOM26815.1 4'-phosphopantetheinyl transferase superfamily protein [bacterium]